MSYVRTPLSGELAGDISAYGEAVFSAAKAFADSSDLYGALSVAGQLTMVAVGSSLLGSVEQSQTTDVAAVAASVGSGIDAVNSAASVLKDISQWLSDTGFQSLSNVMNGLGDVAESVPLFGTALKVGFFLANIIESSAAAEEEEQRRREQAAKDWCKSLYWPVIPSGEGHKVFPWDLFNNVVSPFTKTARGFAPDPLGEKGPPLAMPSIGRTLIHLLESPRMRWFDWTDAKGRPIYLGTSTEQRRQTFIRLRKLIQSAPPGSDGGLSLWPLYCDLVTDEFIRKRGICNDLGEPQPQMFDNPVTGPWGYAYANWYRYGTAPHSCDSSVSGGWDDVKQLCETWWLTFVEPKWASGIQEKQKLVKQVAAGAYSVGLERRPHVYSPTTNKARVNVASTRPLRGNVLAPGTPTGRTSQPTRDVVVHSGGAGGWIVLAALASAVGGGAYYLHTHPETRMRLRARVRRVLHR